MPYLVIIVILAVVVIRLWLAVGDYQRTIDRMEHRLQQYDHELQTTSTWLDDEMCKREIHQKPGERTIKMKVGLN
jgi:predicted Holliday junction resolvase-like endonuclease